MSNFKKCKVVILATDNQSRICFLTQKGKERLDLRYGSIKCHNISDSENQHLYIISSEDSLKEGDKILFENEQILTVKKIRGNYLSVNEHYSDIPVEDCGKIISTTDDTLLVNSFYGIDGFSSKCFGGMFDEFVKLPSLFKLPEPSEEFIEKFVTEYQKGITIQNILVEYEESGLTPKIDNGFININFEPINTIRKITKVTNYWLFKPTGKDGFFYVRSQIEGSENFAWFIGYVNKFDCVSSVGGELDEGLVIEL